MGKACRVNDCAQGLLTSSLAVTTLGHADSFLQFFGCLTPGKTRAEKLAGGEDRLVHERQSVTGTLFAFVVCALLESVNQGVEPSGIIKRNINDDTLGAFGAFGSLILLGLFRLANHKELLYPWVCIPCRRL